MLPARAAAANVVAAATAALDTVAGQHRRRLRGSGDGGARAPGPLGKRYPRGTDPGGKVPTQLPPSDALAILSLVWFGVEVAALLAPLSLLVVALALLSWREHRRARSRERAALGGGGEGARAAAAHVESEASMVAYTLAENYINALMWLGMTLCCSCAQPSGRFHEGSGGGGGGAADGSGHVARARGRRASRRHGRRRQDADDRSAPLLHGHRAALAPSNPAATARAAAARRGQPGLFTAAAAAVAAAAAAAAEADAAETEAEGSGRAAAAGGGGAAAARSSAGGPGARGGTGVGSGGGRATNVHGASASARVSSEV